MFNVMVTFFSQTMFGLPLWLLAIVNVSLAAGIAFVVLGVMYMIVDRRK